MSTDKDGYLRMMSSGRWAIVRFGREPVEITSGELFRVEAGGALKPTRMEFRHFDAARVRRSTHGEYYSVNGYELHGGLRAAIGGES